MEMAWLYTILGVVFSIVFAILNLSFGIEAKKRKETKKILWKRYFIPAITGVIPIFVFYITRFNLIFTAISLIFGLFSLIMFIKEVKRMEKRKGVRS